MHSGEWCVCIRVICCLRFAAISIICVENQTDRRVERIVFSFQFGVGD